MLILGIIGGCVVLMAVGVFAAVSIADEWSDDDGDAS